MTLPEKWMEENTDVLWERIHADETFREINPAYVKAIDFEVKP